MHLELPDIASVIFKAFNFDEDHLNSYILRFIILWYYLFIPFDYVKDSILLALERKNESEADAAAARLGMETDLSSALIKLYWKWSIFPVDDPLYSIFHYNCPTLQKRLENLS